ncbi:hypothetical protein AC249_AIPGENE19248 [Exaiptasia diaphana]|nr:hypothetical protein AC249_AIPGENE19248 [Exaiptasia diaphana]
MYIKHKKRVVKVATKLKVAIPTELAVSSLSNITKNGITNVYQIIGKNFGARQHLITAGTKNGETAYNNIER